MFDVELSTVGKLFLHAFQRYQARYLKRPWCNCPTVFLLRKSRKIAKNRAILRKSFRHISTPQQLLSSSLSPLESSFHALSNGAKLDISRARGAIVQTFFFLENHEKSRKLRVFHRSSAQSAKNKTSRFQHRNASAHSAKNKTGRFQHSGA